MGLTDQIVPINQGVCERYCQTRAVFDGEGPQILRQRFTRCKPRLQADGSHLSRIPRQSFQKCLTNLPKSALPELLKVFRQSSQSHLTKVPKAGQRHLTRVSSRSSPKPSKVPHQSSQKCFTRGSKNFLPKILKGSTSRPTLLKFEMLLEKTRASSSRKNYQRM